MRIGESRLGSTALVAATIVVVGAAGVLYWPFISGYRCEPIGPRDFYDSILYRHVGERVKAGGDYYDAAAAELAEHGYPRSSIFHWRTPLYAWSLGILPNPDWCRPILIILAISLALAWTASMGREYGIIAAALIDGPVLLGSLIWCVLPEPPFFTELWVGILILMSAMLGMEGFILAGLFLGAWALFLRELALPYCLAATFLAFRRRRRREVAGWATVLGLYAVFYLAHSIQVSARGTLGASLGWREWVQFGGLGFLHSLCRMNFNLILLPDVFTPLFLAGSLAGVISDKDPRRAILRYSSICYLIVFFCCGKSGDFYWGWVCAPLLSLGFSRFIHIIIGYAGQRLVRSRELKAAPSP